MTKVLQKSQLLCLIFEHKFEGTFPFLGMICSPPGGKDLNFFQNLSGQKFISITYPNLSQKRLQATILKYRDVYSARRLKLWSSHGQQGPETHSFLESQKKPQCPHPTPISTSEKPLLPSRVITREWIKYQWPGSQGQHSEFQVFLVSMSV